MKSKILYIIALFFVVLSCDPILDESYKTKDFYPEVVSPTVPVKDPMEALFKAKLQYTGYVYPEISGYTEDSISPDSVAKKPIFKYKEDENPLNFEYGIYISRNGNFGLTDNDLIHVSFKGTDKFKVASIVDSVQVYNPIDSTINIVVASQSVANRLLNEWSEYSYMIYAKNKRGKGYTTRGSFITGGTLGFGITTIPTDSVSNITSASAQIKGQVVSSGGRTVSLMGVVYSTDKSVIEGLGIGSAPSATSPFKNSISPTKLTGETGYFDVAITDLAENTKYYFRTYAINGYRDNSRNTVKYSEKIGTIETSSFDGFPIVTYGITANKLIANATKTFNAEIAFKVASRREQVTEYGYYIRENGVYNKVVGVLNSNYKLNNLTSEFVILFNNLAQATETVFRPYVIIDGKENVVEKTPLVRFMSGVFGRIQEDPNNPGVYLNNDPNVYYELPGIPYNGFVYRFLDRNLGAKRSLSELADGFDYPKTGNPTQDNAGWLFQWGRSADGHQKWDASGNTAIQSSTFGYPSVGLNSWDEAWNYKTISKITDPVTGVERDSVSYKFRGAFCSNGGTFSWLSGNTASFNHAKTLWNTSKSGGKNNPCPPGYRVPSSAELSVLLNISGGSWSNFKNLPLPDGSSVPLMFCGSANISRNASGSGYSIRPSGGYSSNTAFFWSCSPTQALNKIMGFGLALSKPTDKGAVSLGTGYSAAGSYIRCISTDILPRQ